MKTINASEFKVKCLAILDEVKQPGEEVTILRGKPVARLVPPAKEGHRYPQHALQGTGKIVGDIIEPPLPPEAWDAERGEL